MNASTEPPIEITAFSWVPDFAKGYVRCLRPRWALEEIGLPYRTRLFHAAEPRPADYFLEQPFGQVPAYREGDLHMFESGAILLHIGEKDERLLPRNPQRRARSMSWLLAAFNSVEPSVMELVSVNLFNANEDWAPLRRPSAMDAARAKLSRVADSLGDREWLEDRFTVADIAMVTVLRGLDHTELLSEFPSLVAYRARGEERPAFARAYRSQLSDFDTGSGQSMEKTAAGGGAS
ncbi:Disulfide-bond oxidoreductase YfcG [Methyloligella halotolerans]|uniref:Disulfide-bond oxidoreductase YfcG n=1 Tax=Methyloligella halotolerans TaxID=1177755 RepID=A0A1E2RWN1_9HYPH|nr:glutathione S-transferase family protein [Methyloligella halotolerans]ODA66498.1 Disulfide-bond oxidoreductase YfcG [Methyloligella halotolerans]